MKMRFINLFGAFLAVLGTSALIIGGLIAMGPISSGDTEKLTIPFIIALSGLIVLIIGLKLNLRGRKYPHLTDHHI